MTGIPPNFQGRPNGGPHGFKQQHGRRNRNDRNRNMSGNVPQGFANNRWQGQPNGNFANANSFQQGRRNPQGRRQQQQWQQQQEKRDRQKLRDLRQQQNQQQNQQYQQNQQDQQDQQQRQRNRRPQVVDQNDPEVQTRIRLMADRAWHSYVLEIQYFESLVAEDTTPGAWRAFALWIEDQVRRNWAPQDDWFRCPKIHPDWDQPRGANGDVGMGGMCPVCNSNHIPTALEMFLKDVLFNHISKLMLTDALALVGDKGMPGNGYGAGHRPDKPIFLFDGFRSNNNNNNKGNNGNNDDNGDQALAPGQCRYWARTGQCKRGAMCTFRHG